MGFKRGSLKAAIKVCYDRCNADHSARHHIVGIPGGKYYVVESDHEFQERLGKPGQPVWRHVFGGNFMGLYQLTHTDQLQIWGGNGNGHS